ncbi:hypothetical protein LCGC14_1823310, partial [marine sediment metagenome]
MSDMILFGGASLQKEYQNCGKKVLSESERLRQKKDHEALAKSRRKQSWRTKVREERMDDRDLRHINPEKEMEILKKNPEKDVDVKGIVKKAKSKTNVIAREHGLAEPNNPEALTHDRLYCMICDRKLDSPYIGQHENSPFEEEEVRIMCCWCFGNMSDSDIKSQVGVTKATAEISLKVYNYEQASEADQTSW